MAVVPEERRAYRQRFEGARKDENSGCCNFLCQTPFIVHLKALECEPRRLRLATDMFPELGLQSEFINEFYVMDVILNRAPSLAASTRVGEGGWWVMVVPIVMWFVMSCRVTRNISRPLGRRSISSSFSYHPSNQVSSSSSSSKA